MREGDETETSPILLGSIYDFEMDEVYLTLKCITCADQTLFTVDEETKSIEILSSTPLGVYRLEFILTDENIEDPKSTLYSFKIEIKKKPKEVEEEVKS